MSTRTDRAHGGEGSPLAGGDLLVPRDTPAGPAAARVGWARGAGTVLKVLDVTRGGRDIAHRVGDSDRELVAGREQLAERYERPDGTAL